MDVDRGLRALTRAERVAVNESVGRLARCIDEATVIGDHAFAFDHEAAENLRRSGSAPPPKSLRLLRAIFAGCDIFWHVHAPKTGGTGHMGDFRYHAGGACKPPHYDDWWCEAARAVGLDTLQIGDASNYVKHKSHQHRQLTEIVVCDVAEPMCGVCPPRSALTSLSPGAPLAMRTGLNASLPCSCDEQIGILNCGRLLPTPCEAVGEWERLSKWATSQIPVAPRVAKG